eukprot:5696247-Pleurochrysis_carterae.AAC.1
MCAASLTSINPASRDRPAYILFSSTSSRHKILQWSRAVLLASFATLLLGNPPQARYSGTGQDRFEGKGARRAVPSRSRPVPSGVNPKRRAERWSLQKKKPCGATGAPSAVWSPVSMIRRPEAS